MVFRPPVLTKAQSLDVVSVFDGHYAFTTKAGSPKSVDVGHRGEVVGLSHFALGSTQSCERCLRIE